MTRFISVQRYPKNRASVTIRDWRPNPNFPLETERGTFSVTFPGGFTIDLLTLCERCKNRWIELPRPVNAFERNRLARHCFVALQAYLECHRLDPELVELAGGAR